MNKRVRCYNKEQQDAPNYQACTVEEVFNKVPVDVETLPVAVETLQEGDNLQQQLQLKGSSKVANRGSSNLQLKVKANKGSSSLQLKANSRANNKANNNKVASKDSSKLQSKASSKDNRVNRHHNPGLP